MDTPHTPCVGGLPTHPGLSNCASQHRRLSRRRSGNVGSGTLGWHRAWGFETVSFYHIQARGGQQIRRQVPCEDSVHLRPQEQGAHGGHARKHQETEAEGTCGHEPLLWLFVEEHLRQGEQVEVWYLNNFNRLWGTEAAPRCMVPRPGVMIARDRKAYRGEGTLDGWFAYEK